DGSGELARQVWVLLVQSQLSAELLEHLERERIDAEKQVTGERPLDVHRDVRIGLAERHLRERLVLGVRDLVSEHGIRIEGIAVKLLGHVTRLARNRIEPAVLPFEER